MNWQLVIWPLVASANTQCGINKCAGLPAKNEGNMFTGDQLPRVATAKLIFAARGRKRGEQVAHEVDGNNVTVTFLTATFFGGIDRWVITAAEFARKFVVITKKGGR